MTLSIATSLQLHTLALSPEASSILQPADDVDNELLVAFSRGQARDPFAVGSLWDLAVAPPPSDGVRPEFQKESSSALDSLSEIGEMESLRLQMAMDRLSKMMGALSNLLDRIDSTQAAITQNIK